jgi:3-dehydroquinate synthase
MHTLRLNDYPIHIGSGQWPQLRALVEALDPSRLLVLCDAHTRIYCLPRLQEELEVPEHQVVTIPAGERHKTLDSCRYIWERMMQLKLDRRALMLNLGGGVVGDMGGLCACLFKRGLPFVQLPTSLLAQVDASVGGKLAIDFASVKNSIGLFANPEAVFIFPGFLATLPERELRSGFAEVIKHALLGDPGHWAELKGLNSLSGLDWPALLVRSLRVKQRIVEEDPREAGPRKLLNFGHTVGHALESAFLLSESPLTHGEAVAIGLVCECYLSHLKVGLSLEVVQEVAGLVRSLYPHRNISNHLLPQLLELMQNDKKNEGGEIRFSLLQAPGQGRYDLPCDRDEIADSLGFYNSHSLSLFS